MKPKILLRIAAILLVLFAAGHTSGHLGRKKNPDPEGQKVLQAMERYKFTFMGTEQTLDGHMEGYGMGFTFMLVALIGLLWIISIRTENDPKYSQLLLYPILFFMLGNAYVAYRYFFMGPTVFSLIVCLLLVVSMVMLGRRKVA
jgi:hypothetical protein